ncbi:MAG: (2Fe-2S)-binding protein [Chloroflexi bacterium]|nr:MAG: (2Fe-2S)-binding protein [Chloroflexota bacterium]TMC28134.1 MAG: (2Fe-2S)-binding protein [Chloroflexota bacterium]TMC54517.1 MAG: (2Fe-2S)-binding protein [Chloroflexota bacterium]TME39713.1 MAG: (2Fe-2S)-binding protein [Chloroflexota bacterium]
MARSIRVRLNGTEREVQIEDHVLMLEMLRGLGFLGAKLSCDAEVCGACTVLLDGRPVSACTTLALEAEGRRLETIEGLAQEKKGGAAPPKLHPLQQAFIDNFAFQCGYCTPGMIIAAKSLLDEKPRPTPAEVRHWMEGNICRCTGYQTIVDAVLDAAGASGEPR